MKQFAPFTTNLEVISMYTFAVVITVVGAILILLSMLGMAWCSGDSFPNLRIANMIVAAGILGIILIIAGSYSAGWIH
jgi:hypothetical protein